jgi:hypothetical protein
MKKRKQDFALGVTAIVFLGLFVGTVLFLVPTLGARTRPLVVYFPHEEGIAPLKPGSPVLLGGGIQVGQVTGVEAREVPATAPGDPRPRTVIAVDVRIDRSLPLYGNCSITTEMPLVGGSGTVVIANVGTPGVPLPADHLEGEAPQGMAAFAAFSRRLTGKGGLVDRVDRMLDPDASGSLLNKIMQSLLDVNAMTAALRTQLSVDEQQTLLAKLHRILDDLNATTTAVREELQAGGGENVLAKLRTALDLVQQDLTEVQAVLKENRPALQSTLASVEHTARVVDQELLSRLRAEFDPSAPGSLLGKLHVAMDGINASVADFQVVSETGKRLVVLNRPQIERILANLKETSEELTAGSREVRLNPAKLIWGAGPAQQDKLGAFAAARDFAQAATFLDDAAARLQAILEVTPPAGQAAPSDEEVTQIYEALRSAFERFQRAEAFFWDKLK